MLSRPSGRSVYLPGGVPQTVYSLAFTYMEMGDIEKANKHFRKVLEVERFLLELGTDSSFIARQKGMYSPTQF